MLEFILLSTVGLLSLILGLFVLLKNTQSRTHQLFFMLVVSFVAFSAINYISLHPVLFSQLFWIRLDLLSGVLLFLFTFLTFDVFPGTRFDGSRRSIRTLLILYALFVAILTMTPLVFSHLHLEGGNVQPVPAPGIIFLLVQHLGYLLATMVLIVKKYRKSSGIEKQQYVYVITGISLGLSCILIFNLLLVQAFQITTFVVLGSFGPLLFSLAFAYAIVRHRLLDIRAVVARSVAYVVLLAVVAATYVGGIYLSSAFIFGYESIARGQTIFNVLLAIVLALTLRPLQSTIERYTDNIFYRNRYNSQKVLNGVGSVVTAELNLDSLLNRGLDLLCQHLRIDSGQFLLFKDTKIYRDNHYGTLPYKALDFNKLTPMRNEIFVADELELNDSKRFLDQNRIKVSIPLKTKKEFLGYLLLGEKRSGDIYTNQDIELLEIASREFSVAIVNAKAYQEIQEFNVVLQKKVDEATRHLRETNAKLRKLDQIKDDFISMASHQLRTPLTSVKGYVSMVLEGDAGKLTDLQRKMLNQSFLSSQRMSYLISDLLNISRLRTGKFVIEPVAVNLADLIDEEIKQLVETAKSRDLELSFNKPEHFPTLLLDENKLRQVIMNFIDNAIYYTPSGGHIQVNLVDRPESIEFTVVDDGIGVPKSEQHHLFSKFYRAQNARKARPDGTGLGIFMAKKVVIAQGGAIIFKSTENKGSTFGFTFPKTKLKVAPDAHGTQLNPENKT